jgi:hypothetical protein
VDHLFQMLSASMKGRVGPGVTLVASINASSRCVLIKQKSATSCSWTAGMARRLEVLDAEGQGVRMTSLNILRHFWEAAHPVRPCLQPRHHMYKAFRGHKLTHMYSTASTAPEGTQPEGAHLVNKTTWPSFQVPSRRVNRHLT